MFREQLRDEVSQGDIFPSLPVSDHETSTGGSDSAREIRAIVLSHDCEYDKLELGAPAEHVLVVEMRPPEHATGGRWGHIKKGRVWNALHVLEGENHGAGFADFRRLYRVRKDRLEEARDQRLASMTDEGRRVLVYALTSFLLHEKIDPQVDEPQEEGPSHAPPSPSSSPPDTDSM